MGKRSINSTKSGKFMNPTDQARKEARRKELKKNKKQRLLVRQTVLKGKDPTTIFAELEKIDQMEFNPVQAAPLSEKVLKEKRKKLRDTLNRIMRLYEKEEPAEWTKIKAMEVQYEKRRAELIIYCESVKHTQTVNLEEIPLPNIDAGSSSSSMPTPHGILKKFSSYSGKMFRKPPGVPSVPPPELYDIWDEGDGAVVEPGIPGIDDEDEADLPPYHTYYQFIRPPVDDIELPQDHADDDKEMKSDSDEDDDEDDDDDSDNEGKAQAAKPVVPEPLRPTTLQARMLAMAGQDVNTVIQEMDYLHRQKEMNRQVTFEARKARMEAGDFDDDQDMDAGPSYPHHPPHPAGFPRPPMMPPYPPMGQPPSVYGGFAPPPMPGSRLPPGPPPRMPPGMNQRMVRPPGMPPPPPPGLRPGAPPMMGSRPQASAVPPKPPSKPGASIIEAKPQMRNLSADLTRFVPTTLKVKKDAHVPIIRKDVPKPSINPHIEWRSQTQATTSRAPAPPQQPVQTKDDAYSQFLKEMQGLL